MADNDNKKNGDKILNENYTTEISNFFGKGVEQRNYNYVNTNVQKFKPVSAFEPKEDSNVNQSNTQNSTDNGGDKK